MSKLISCIYIKYIQLFICQSYLNSVFLKANNNINKIQMKFLNKIKIVYNYLSNYLKVLPVIIWKS